MRSIFRMPSDDMAGDAKRRVPIPNWKGGRQMRSIFRMPSDDMAGDAKRRVPIKYLSDRMFEYFFIDSHQGAVLEPPEEISSAFRDYLSELCAMLDCSGFYVNDKALEWKHYFVQVNTDYMGRIVNNIFSNIEKYADREKEVKIWMIYEQERVGIAVENIIAMPNRYVEGTGIGVKNISLMMEQMGGTAEVVMTEEDYRIEVYFPIKEQEEKNS